MAISQNPAATDAPDPLDEIDLKGMYGKGYEDFEFHLDQILQTQL